MRHAIQHSTPASTANRMQGTVQGRAKLSYLPKDGVRSFGAKVFDASSLEMVELERVGVRGSLLKDLASEMAIPASRLYQIIGMPKATAEKKAAANEMIAGAAGQAVLGLVKLLALAQSIAANSLAKEAKGFDAAKWLGLWIERPQPALGGKRPSDILDTPTGAAAVARLLGASESGAYQ